MLFPYVNIFLSSRGLSPAEIGLISALRPWVAAPASIAATSLADRTAQHRPLLLAGLAASAALRAGLPAARGAGALFAVILAAEAFGFFGVLGDATILSNLAGKEGAGGSYGDQRAWASIGWGAFGVVGGVAINKYGIEAAPFVGFGLLSALLFVVGACMRYDYGGWGPAGVANRPGDTGDGDNAGRPYQLAADTEAAAAGGGGGAGAAGDASMRALLRRPEIIIFLFEATMLGFGMGVTQGFEFIYVRDLGGSEALMGLCLLAMTCAEVPAFALQGPLLARVPVPVVIDAALAALALRMALYATLPAAFGPWAVLPIDLLHGITFAAAWGACTVHAGAAAPPALAASFQGVMQACWLGVGTGLGGLAGGVLMQQAGGRGLFATCTAVMLGAWGTAVAARRAVGGGAGVGLPGSKDY